MHPRTPRQMLTHNDLLQLVRACHGRHIGVVGANNTHPAKQLLDEKLPLCECCRQFTDELWYQLAYDDWSMKHVSLDLSGTCPHGCKVEGWSTKVCQHTIPTVDTIRDIIIAAMTSKESAQKIYELISGIPLPYWCEHHRYNGTEWFRKYNNGKFETEESDITKFCRECGEPRPKDT